MQPQSHPSDELLRAYGVGWAPPAVELCVAVHLEGCARCAGFVREVEAAESETAHGLEPEPMAPDALAAMMAKLDALPVPTPRPERATLGDVPLPHALRRMRIAPRRWVRPGLWIAHLPEARHDGWRAYLLRAPPGQGLPTHAHSGPELICVLAGAFKDQRTHSQGDFVEDVAPKQHRLDVLKDDACACLIATKGPLRWQGWRRALGPMLSI